jgi:ubiquinone/menaquinone biosynthesis C-methylase UbiE
MLWFHRRTAAERVTPQQLSRRLKKLATLFDINAIRSEALDGPAIQAYYRECHAAYRKHHSPEGAAHMALNPGGRFDPEGFAEHLRRMAARWRPASPRDVLEIGFGQGYNLGWLAPRHPQVAFTGIDLTPEHFELATHRMQAEGIGNVQLQLADFHRLPFADASFDEVYAIEAFCYARDTPAALAEVARVLRPGGRFTLFDGYQPKPSPQMSEEGALAVELVARGTSLERWQVPDELVQQAAAVGYELEALHWLNEQTLPNLKKLDRLVSAIIRWPWLAKKALARRAQARSRNVLSGYLLYPTVAMGILGYCEIVLKKTTTKASA